MLVGHNFFNNQYGLHNENLKITPACVQNCNILVRNGHLSALQFQDFLKNVKNESPPSFKLIFQALFSKDSCWGKYIKSLKRNFVVFLCPSVIEVLGTRSHVHHYRWAWIDISSEEFLRNINTTVAQKSIINCTKLQKPSKVGLESLTWKRKNNSC